MSKDSAQRSGFIPSLVRRLRGGSTPARSAADDARVTTFLAALQEVSAKMKADLPLPDLMAALAEQSVVALEADLALVRLTNLDGEGLVVSGVHGVAPHRVAGLLGSFSVVTEPFRALWPGSLAAFDLRGGKPPLMTSAEFNEMAELRIIHLLVLPLHHRGRLVGRLDLGRVEDVPFSVDDRAAGTVLAGLIASAVAGSPAGEDRERLAVLEASYEFQQSIQYLSTAAETLQSMVESIRGITGCDRCYGLLWQEPKREFTPVAVSGLESHLMDALKAALFSAARLPSLTEALAGPDPVVIEDAQRSPVLPAETSRALGIRSAILVPLRGREDRVLGALMLDYTRPDHRVTEQELIIVRNTAEQASVVLENALLYEDVKRTSESLALVNEIGLDLATLSDLDGLFRQLHHHVSSVIDAQRFCLGLLLPDGASLEYRYAVDQQLAPETVTVPLGHDPLSWVVKEQRRVVVNARHPKDRTVWFPPLPDVSTGQSMIAVPLRVGQRAIGVLSAQSDARGAYTHHDVNLLVTVGMQTAVAIENARLYMMVQQRGELRGYLLDQMLSRQEQERKMLVDDIHNDTLQGLASCLYRIDLTSRRVTEIPPEETRQELLGVRENLAENIDRLRRLIFQIRPSTLDILGLGPAIQEYFSQIEQETGIRATLDIEMADRLESEQETIVYRMVQEALEHVRQRPGVSRVVVRIREREGKVVITIADDGQAMEPTDLAEPVLIGAAVGNQQPSDARVNLLTLQERAALAGGQVRLASRNGGGSTIQIVLPQRSSA